MSYISAQGANFSSISVTLGRFPKEHRTEAEQAFRHLNILGSNFSNAKLEHADFSGANLVGSSFVASSADFADFSDTSVIGASFHLAQLTGAKFDGAEALNADFVNAKGLKRRQLEAARNLAWDRVPPDLPNT